MNEDGTMAPRARPHRILQKRMSLKMVTVAELIRYRMRTERYVHRLGEAQLPATSRRLPHA